MTPRSAIISAVAALVLAVVAWQVVAELAGGSPAPEPADSRAHAGLALAPRAEDDSTAESQPSRRAIGARASAQRKIDRDRDLHGRVVDGDGVPIPGAAVEVLRSAAQEYHFLDFEHNRRRHRVHASETDARGEFVVPLSLGRPFTLEVGAARFARESRVVYAGQHVEIVLRPGATLLGRVTRADGGSPVAGAVVVGRWPRGLSAGVRRPEVFRGRTDASGKYRFDGLSAGQIQLRVLSATEASPRATDLQLVAGQQCVHDVVLERGTEIRGRVIDAATRQPIAGAEVGEGWMFSKSVTTDGDGRYVYRGFPDSHRDLEVRAPGYGRSEKAVRDPRTREVPDVVDFELHAARRARGRVIGPDGRPLEAAYVAAPASDYENPGNSQRIDWPSGETAPDGSFELVDLRRDMRHFLLVAKAGHGTLVFDFPPSEVDASVVELGVIRLERQSMIRGVVVDAAGDPVAGHAVTLHGSNADRDRLAGSQRVRAWNIDGYVARRSGLTDDLGRWSFGDLAAGTYTAGVELGGSRSPVTAEVTVRAGEVADGVQLVLPRGLGLRGRVELADRGPMPKVYIAVEPADGQESAGHAEVRVTGEWGVAGLLPGRYRVTAYPYQTPADKVAGRRFAPRRLTGVRAGRVDVVLELLPAVATTGRVVDPRGLPVPAAYVTAIDASGLHVDGATADDEGAFVLRLARGSHVTLQANQPRDKGAPASPRVTAEGIAAGSRDVILQLRH